MLLAGVPLEQVSILLGYKSMKITEKHYAPLGQSSTRAACCQCRKAWTVLKRRWQEVWPEATAEGEDCLKRRKSTTQIQLAHRSLLCTRRRTISGTLKCSVATLVASFVGSPLNHTGLSFEDPAYGFLAQSPEQGKTASDGPCNACGRPVVPMPFFLTICFQGRKVFTATRSLDEQIIARPFGYPSPKELKRGRATVRQRGMRVNPCA